MSRKFSTKEKEGVVLKKQFGQNLLSDQNQVKKVIEAAQIEKGDIVLEIGPGLGAITMEMAKKAKKVICVEKDREMVSALKIKIEEAGIDNVEIIESDVLNLFTDSELNIEGLKDYRIVANIPYYLTSLLIRNLLEVNNPPKDIYLMIQKEVGQRICAKPGDMSILSVAVQYYANPKVLFTVSKNSFFPRPKIDSVFIRITPKGVGKNDQFFKLVKAGFSHPRKQLINNLSTTLKLDKEEIKKWLKDNGLKPGERAEVLSLPQWESLFTSLKGKL